MRTLAAGWSLLLLGALTGRADFNHEVTLWRGESLSTVLPDRAHELTSGGEGVDIDQGTLLPVRYLPNYRGFEYKFVADRAVYGSKESGLHFATITAARDAKPGTYHFGQLTVKVLDRVLPPPAAWKYYLDLWQHPWAVARINGLTPFSDAHYRAMEPLWKQLASAGQKALTVTLVDKPWNRQCYDAYGSMIGRRKGADGKWSFDYSVFDRYVEFGRACGIGPHISCYTMCPWGYMIDYIGPDGNPVRVEAKPGTPVFDDYWHDFLVDFERHLQAKGWLADTYIAMDERSPEDLQYIAKFVKRVAPGLKIAMAGNCAPSEFAGIEIDSYSQFICHVDEKFLGEVPARREAGKVTTYYVCCGPARPNTFMESTPGEAFVCGFYPAACGLDGLLRWAYNSWGEDPVNDMTYNSWKAGDVALVYPDGSPSWRFLELKNGIQQAEKFRLLAESGERAAELKALAAKFALKPLLDGTDYLALREDVLKALNR